MVMSRGSACAAAALSANQTGANHVTHDRLRNLDHLLRDEHPRPLRGFKHSSLALVHRAPTAPPPRLRTLDPLLRDEHPRPLRGFKQSSLALVHACRKAGSLTALAAPLAVLCPGTGGFCLQPRAIGPPSA